MRHLIVACAIDRSCRSICVSKWRHLVTATVHTHPKDAKACFALLVKAVHTMLLQHLLKISADTCLCLFLVFWLHFQYPAADCCSHQTPCQHPSWSSCLISCSLCSSEVSASPDDVSTGTSLRLIAQHTLIFKSRPTFICLHATSHQSLFTTTSVSLCECATSG